MRNRDFIVLIFINFKLIIIDFYWLIDWSNYIDFVNFSKLVMDGQMDQLMDGRMDRYSL